jgi:hypothetical protein
MLGELVWPCCWLSWIFDGALDGSVVVWLGVELGARRAKRPHPKSPKQTSVLGGILLG